jgi:hypothetical protein
MLRAIHQFLVKERNFKREATLLAHYRWQRSAVNKRSISAIV